MRVSESVENSRDLMVIDGGVFENYGARTPWELADALHRADTRLEPIVVLISNDSDEEPTQCQGEPTAQSLMREFLANLHAGEEPGGVGVPEFLTSMLGLYNTRGGHARGEIATLRQQFCDGYPWHLFHFDLPKPDTSKGQSAPMNWVLDPNSCKFMLGDARRPESIRNKRTAC